MTIGEQYQAWQTAVFLPLIYCRAVFGGQFWLSFLVAFIATMKVFLIGGAGFVMVRYKWLNESGLQALSQLVALLTAPCLVFYRFATQFDPAVYPNWWLYAIIGALISLVGLLFGKLIAWRHGGNEEATMLVGFQNAGFFVLPMLQAILPPEQYNQGSLLLFVLLIPFNAMMWMFGSWLLLKRRGVDPATFLTPPVIATVIALLIYGLAHDWAHRWDDTLLSQVLLGEPGRPGGVLQLLGDLTVPLATITLGGSIAINVRGQVQYKRAALEVALMKLIVMPLLGYFVLRQFLPKEQYVTWVLLMLQFAAPPGLALAVFSQQYGYKMTLIPAACLLCYILCLATVPFFVALVPR